MRAKKRFGQNFLQDPLIIGDIVGLVPNKANLHILEIGPGQGALTKQLCRIDPSMTVVELDRDLIHGLEALLPTTATSSAICPTTFRLRCSCICLTNSITLIR